MPIRCGILFLALASLATGIPLPRPIDPASHHLDLVASTEAGVLLEKPVPPGLCDTVKQHAGYFNVTTSTKHYFYWFFESRSTPTVDPLVLWMTGGPGCSSGIALFNENGPCSVEMSGMSTRKNMFSWNRHASLLFVDQPAGTGFSYGESEDYDHNEGQVSQDMYHFLQAFYTAHPEVKPVPFFVFGESYGGHFVPATAGAILTGNAKADRFQIPLKGVGIGNGLTAPEIQYGYYGVYAAENPVRPLVSTAVSLAMRASSEVCRHEIAECQKTPDYMPSPALLDAIAQYNASSADADTALSLLFGDRGPSRMVDSACNAAFVFCALSQVGREGERGKGVRGREEGEGEKISWPSLSSRPVSFSTCRLSQTHTTCPPRLPFICVHLPASTPRVLLTAQMARLVAGVAGPGHRTQSLRRAPAVRAPAALLRLQPDQGVP